MRTVCAKLALGLLSGVLIVSAAAPDSAIAAYKSGDYKTAIPLLQTAARADAKDPLVSAALLSASGI